jgi:hypothetical membrane protein
MMLSGLLLAAFLVSWTMTLILRRYALAKSLIDIPNERSSHSIPTPRGGGVAIVLTFALTLPVLSSIGLIATQALFGLLGAGLLIPFWLFFGVLLTASRFPGYSHVDLAMSQLGAVGAPTHDFSPWVNNVPLGVLFVICAVGLLRRFRGSGLATVSALLVLVHGLASISAGVFPCDQGCLPAQPSLSQKLHNLSGLVMFVSLTLASASWIFLGRRLLGSVGFAFIKV